MNVRALAAPLLAALTACGGQTGSTLPRTPPDADALSFARNGGEQNAIKHVVIIIQENRSFDNIFAGFPGADTTMTGRMHGGRRVPLEQITFEVHDMDHYFATGLSDYDDGKMDGFNLNSTSGTSTIGRFALSYLSRSEVAPYWTMAKQYVLADHMFPTMFGPSFTGHLTLIAGTADLNPEESLVNFPSASPWGCDAPKGTTTSTVDTERITNAYSGPFPCFTQFATLADTLDAAHVSWRYYAPKIGSKDSGQLWSSFDAIRDVRYGKDWNNVVSPPTRVLTDAANNRLASVSWVVPDFLWSDHPYAGTPYGPSWVSAVINAIGSSPDWKSTAIVVVWDDWGGFYDNVPPPQRDFRGLGIRVGCMIVSPYVHPHVVHTDYEFGSIVRFVEDVFGLPQLGSTADGYTDARATSLTDSFDFTMKPRSFQVIPAQYPASYFFAMPPSGKPPDEY